VLPVSSPAARNSQNVRGQTTARARLDSQMLQWGRGREGERDDTAVVAIACESIHWAESNKCDTLACCNPCHVETCQKVRSYSDMM
jgi:hypothetical protein